MLRNISSALVAILTVFVFCDAVSGHATNEAYIWLDPQADRFDGKVQIRLDDLRNGLGLEIPESYDAAEEAVLANADAIESYIKLHFTIATRQGDPIPYQRVKFGLMESEYFGHFAEYYFETDIMEEVPSVVVVSGSLFLEDDQFFRVILKSEYNHFTGETYPETSSYAIFKPWESSTEVDFNNIEIIRSGRKYYLWEGIRHIWIGIDHILFLVTLLLALVLVRREVTDGGETQNAAADATVAGRLKQRRFEWVPVDGFRDAFWSIFKIVTIFTIAHSITLCLASLNIISLPSQLVESVIALSIVLVALNNIMPRFHDRTWVILFLFGLFHGLGFASVMQNLPFRMSNLPRLLLCFNVGVEIGQLAIVAAVFPLIFLLRKSKFYQPVVLVGGSIVICLIASYWFIERAFGWA